MTDIACPFTKCGATVTLLVVRTDPGDAAATAHAIPVHEFVGEGMTGPCPTSYLTYPLGPEAFDNLADIADALDRAAAAPAPPREPSAELPPHPLAPRYTRSHWLGGPKPGENRTRPDEPSPNGDSREPPVAGAAPPQTPPRRALRVLGPDRYTTDPPETTNTKGGSMANVGETRAAIGAANEKIAQAMVNAQQAASDFDEAHAMLNAIQGVSGAVLGGPACEQAREQCEQAFVRGHSAIEINSTYMGQL